MNTLHEYNRHAAEGQIWLFVNKPQGKEVGTYKKEADAWRAARERAAQLIEDYGFECYEDAAHNEIHLWQQD